MIGIPYFLAESTDDEVVELFNVINKSQSFVTLSITLPFLDSINFDISALLVFVKHTLNLTGELSSGMIVSSFIKNFIKDIFSFNPSTIVSALVFFIPLTTVKACIFFVSANSRISSTVNTLSIA